MISFKKFVDEIHDAIQEANESLMGNSDGLLNNYFARSDEVETILANLDNAIEASDNVTNKGVAATTGAVRGPQMAGRDVDATAPGAL